MPKYIINVSAPDGGGYLTHSAFGEGPHFTARKADALTWSERVDAESYIGTSSWRLVDVDREPAPGESIAWIEEI